MNELISLLREELHLTEDDATNDEILKATEGTLLRGRIELRLALADIEKEIKREIISIDKKLNGKEWPTPL